MLIGVTVDFLAFERIDLLFENLVLIGYLTMATLGIVTINLYKGGVIRGKILDKLRLWLPLLVQFSFGGLFSAFMVFYLRSASIVTSWPFFVILLALMVGNEFFRKKYLHIVFHMSVYFLALYSYMIFILPIVFKRIDVVVFIASGIVSLAVMMLFVYALSKIIPNSIKRAKKPLVWSIRTIFVFINLFYFANIIPPIPLALKDAGVYYDVVRSGNYYNVRFEKSAWYKKLGRDVIRVREGDPVYVFASVFSPTNLNIQITHSWQYRDTKTKEWTVADKLTYPIVGGRDGGYRGYSVKRAVFPGEWRVDIETSDGRVIGRIRFDILSLSDDYQLVLGSGVL